MKILIIEDEYNLADAVSSMLKSKKYSVEIKTDGEEGLDEACVARIESKEYVRTLKRNGRDLGSETWSNINKIK